MTKKRLYLRNAQWLSAKIFARVGGLLVAAMMLCFAPLTWAENQNLLDLEALKGKVVYVDFWASWCSPCRDSFPWMQQIQRQYLDSGLVVIAVNLDQEKPLADAFLRKYAPQFRVAFDPSGTLAEQYHVQGMPTSFMIDRGGKVRYQHIGFQLNQRNEYEQQLLALLSEK